MGGKRAASEGANVLPQVSQATRDFGAKTTPAGNIRTSCKALPGVTAGAPLHCHTEQSRAGEASGNGRGGGGGYSNINVTVLSPAADNPNRVALAETRSFNWKWRSPLIVTKAPFSSGKGTAEAIRGCLSVVLQEPQSWLLCQAAPAHPGVPGAM